jgi:DNA-binding transcriptional LysR family regulator
MDRLDAMRAFVAVGEAQGFAPAARRLGLSPPAVTRAVAALEERVGTRLLHRTTRIVRLTDAGARFLADCRRILGELDEAEASAAGSHTKPAGLLTVTAPVLFGRLFVAPVVIDFLKRHPAVSVRTILLDRVADLIEEGLDVGIRIAHLPDSSMAAIRVGEVRRVVCAAPDYLARRGIPKTPADLARHDVISFGSADGPVSWPFVVRGRSDPVTPPARLMVNTADVAVSAAIGGYGLTQVLSYQAAAAVRARKLRIVLAEFEQPPIPIHVVHAEGRRANARVRAFVDFAARRLRAVRTLP